METEQITVIRTVDDSPKHQTNGVFYIEAAGYKAKLQWMARMHSAN